MVRIKAIFSYRFNYLNLLIPILIGVCAGLFGIAFLKAIHFFTELFLVDFAGYIPPYPLGEGGSLSYKFFMEHPYMIPISTAVGGLIVGILVQLFSPESAGVGTDAAIKAFHEKKEIGIRTSIWKLITSAVTIGSGQVSGKEGPIALIGAGIGSFIGKIFHLPEKERKIALAVGLGAGIGGVFKAPFAGAIISSEVFYKKDFEIETLVPAFIASFVSFIIVASVFGFSPLFYVELPQFTGFSFYDAVGYITLGMTTAFIARLMIYALDSIRSLFERLEVPFFVKPAIGGFFVGIIGMSVPVAIGTGYGWLQLIMLGKLEYFPEWKIIISIFLVILAFAFTLGSGGSGGVFGPSLVIGGLTGASVYFFLKNFLFFPESSTFNLTAFTVVGMVSTFAAAAKAPLSTIILVAEITGGYQLLIPATIAVAVSHFLSGEKSIFKSQVNTKLDSPVHYDEFKYMLLRKYLVKDVMKKEVYTTTPDTTVLYASKFMEQYSISALPVIDEENRVIGLVTSTDIIKACGMNLTETKVRDIMKENPLCITQDLTLFDTLSIFVENNIGVAPVVNNLEDKKIIGIISDYDIGKVLTGKV
ncbi:chloride channel protein, CIC family [Persephonella hydrogeniphila]|uniref:Chloride channel protein, CIC family n=1 Tax=Persephonella hydrogeniphila TaxID=198703 RepID=A0A285N135_9AQUI|nr:chloride channel protein [Persephonella hydrogeniphila]SNZ03159.1 chloride channel protein, CIC family [Persephonella hydrogeniphila]